jgi:type II secretory pathway component GspD/PulD (secretin)
MRIEFHRMAAVVGALVAVMAPAAHAQAPVQPGLGRYSVTLPNRTIITLPLVIGASVSTTVSAPDGGTVTVGGYGRLSEGRTEFGPPGLGKLPGVGRGLRNVGYGRSLVGTRVSASVRIIDLHEEEERQTGVRSR